jgi:hypothetical protein
VQRLEEGRGLSEKSQEELESLEREVTELRLKEETLPKEVRTKMTGLTLLASSEVA